MATLPQPVLSVTVERHSGAHFAAASASLTGYRPTLEDAAVVEAGEAYGLFGVFDGHGGPRCASHLAKQLPPLISSLGAPPIPDDALSQALVQLDQKYITTCTAGAGGSTAAFAVAVYRDTGLYDVQVANVGDSRVLVGRPEGDAVRVLLATTEHKPDDRAERDRIVQAGGCVVGGRLDANLSVSRAFGDRDLKKDASRPYHQQKLIAVPDVYHLTCEPGDVVVVCCDGMLEGDVTEQEVLNFAHKQTSSGQEVGQVAAELCELAVERNSKDNVTCVVVLLQPDAPAKKAAPEFLPGPYSLPQHEAFRTAYRSAATRFGWTLEQALAARREFATRRVTELRRRFGLRDGDTAQPDYAAWGEAALAAVLRAEGLRASCDVAAMAAQCHELGSKEGRVLEPVPLRALRSELEAKPATSAVPAAPAAAPAVAEDWGAAEPAPPAPAAAAPAADDGPPVELPEADDWEDLDV